MNVGVAIEEVQFAEIALAVQLVAIAEHHCLEGDLYRTAIRRLGVCAEHLCRIRPWLTRLDSSVVEAAAVPGFIAGLRRAVAGPGVRSVRCTRALLSDLRDSYGTAHRAEVSWIVLQHAATATHDADLLDIATHGAVETEQTWTWLRTRVKDATPRAVAAA